MKNRTIAAPAAALPANLPLTLSVPRASWPGLIEHASAALAGRCIVDSETLARELGAIAAALRVDGYDELCDALRDCIEAEQPMAHMHATENARAVLRCVGGAA